MASVHNGLSSELVIRIFWLELARVAVDVWQEKLAPSDGNVTDGLAIEAPLPLTMSPEMLGEAPSVRKATICPRQLPAVLTETLVLYVPAVLTLRSAASKYALGGFGPELVPNAPRSEKELAHEPVGEPLSELITMAANNISFACTVVTLPELTLVPLPNDAVVLAASKD